MNPLIEENGAELHLSSLDRRGFVVVPVLLGSMLRQFSEWFEEAVQTAPELRSRIEPNTKVVLEEVAYLPFSSVWYAP